MQIKEVMTGEVKGIASDASVRQAAKGMADTDVGVLPVTQDGNLVGMITDRDITVRVLGADLDPDDTTVGKVMTPDLFTVSAAQDVSEAGRAMQEKQVRRAPVLDDENRLVGIVALADIAVKCGDPELCAELLKGVSQPASPNL